MKNEEKSECNCGYEEVHGLTCPSYIPTKNPMEEKCPAMAIDKPCEEDHYGNCYHCGRNMLTDKKSPQEEEWEKEFDDKFDEYCFEFVETRKQVKSYIQSLIEARVQEVYKKGYKVGVKYQIPWEYLEEEQKNDIIKSITNES